jgi:hypothetical protein
MRAQILLSVVVVLTCAAVAYTQDEQQSEPIWRLKFNSYKAMTIYKGKPAPARIETQQRYFRTRIREGAKEGPNFAGKYTIASWGCGSGCVSFVVVDAHTGKVYDNVPFSILGLPYQGTESQRDYRGLVYKLGSRLLIADGCPEDEPKNCGTHYYEWLGKGFKKLLFEPQPQKRDGE